MSNSKWNYVALGASIMGAFLGAVLHNGSLLLLNLFFAVVNWYAAEDKRHEEDQLVIAKHEIEKQLEEHNDDR